MKLNGVSVLAVLALAGAAIAAPRESTSFPNSIPSASNGTLGGRTQLDAITVLNQTFTGGYTAVRVNLTGSLTSMVAISYSSEAQIYVIPPAGAPFTVAPFTGQQFTNVAIPAGYGVNLAGSGYDPVGQWTYRFFETYQDGGSGVTNSTWDNLVITFDDAVPPPPPPPTASIDFGVLAPSPDFLPAQSVDITDPAQVGWVKFIVPQAITAANGRYLDIDTQGSSMADTYMVWFDSTGTPMPGLVNDDGGVGVMSLMSFGSGVRPGPGGDALNYSGQNGNLAAGTYWVAVCDYFPTGIAAPYQITPGGDLGTINVNLRYGEAPPPAPPTVFFNMGTIPTTSTFATHTFGLDAATVKWAKFTLASPIAAASSTFLDLDTETSSVLFTAICLYKPDGTIAGQDTVDGSASLSQLSFGAGTRPAEADGAMYNGRDGATLDAGDYYVAVSLTPAAFAGGWQAASTSADAGDLVLRIRAGTQPPPTPPAVFTDLGTLAAGLRSESGPLTGPEIKWFKFIVNADVSVANNTFLDIDTENSARIDATAYDTYMALFDNLGAIRATDDDDGSGFHSQFSFGQTTPTRPAISTNGAAAGVVYDGRDGTLVAGTYWLAAYGFANAVGSPAAGFIVSSTSAQDGTLVVNINYGTPVPPAPPASFTNLNTLAMNDTFVTSSTNVINQRQVAWYKFTLASDISRSARTYLDMDTETSTVDATAMALFNGPTGALILQDAADGSGNLSQISIGKGTRPAPGDGVAYNGRDLATLAAGEYFVAVTSAPAAFGAGWQAVSSNTNTGGTLVFNIRAGTVPIPPGTFSKTADGGETVADAIVVGGNGSLTAIEGFLSPNHTDVFRIQVCDFANFSASTVGGVAFDTQLFLFKSLGDGVTFCDDNTGGIAGPSTITSANLTVNGVYYLAISQYNRDPVDEGGALLWNNEPFEGERAPDGPGAVNPLASWTGATAAQASYTIALTGACFVSVGPTPCNAADVAGLGGSVGPDHALTPDDLIVYLNAFFTGNLAIADIAVLGGNAGQDGQLTADDIVFFLSQFFSPCNP